MEFKKKTIIWEDNNEPPKDYIWAKKDGKFYEYSYTTRSWIESKLIKAEESGGNSEEGDGSGEGTIDYENIYQFYKQQLLSKLPSDVIETFIIPEHLEDVIDLEGIEHESDTPGIWLTELPNPIENGVDILFSVPSDENMTYIVVGEYRNTTSPTHVG